MFLLFSYLTARLARVYFHPSGAETLKLPLRPDRQTDSVGGERGEQGVWALGLPVWGSRLRGDKLLAIYPAEPLACSIYGNTTDTSEIQVDPFSSLQKDAGVGGGGGGALRPSSPERHKYQICGQLGGNHPTSKKENNICFLGVLTLSVLSASWSL